MAMFARKDGEAVFVVGKSKITPEQLDRERTKEWFVQQLAGRSLRQIASKYGVSYGTVRNRLLDIPEIERDKLRRMYFGGAA